MIALIVGIASQDGTYLAEFLLSKGYQVVGTIRSSGDASTFIPPQIIQEIADLSDYASLEAVIKKYQPNEIYNLAAFSVSIDSWDKAYLAGQINALGPVLILEAIRLHAPQAKFFQASSREIFGPVASGVANENTPISPTNPYAISKSYAHFMTQCYRNTHGLFAVSGILFNHESPRRPDHFITRKITKAAARIKVNSQEKLTLWNLNSPRDRGFAKEYVEAMWLMLQASNPKDYVIATGELHTVADICDIAFSRVGLNYKDHLLLEPSPVPEVTDSVKGDASLIKTDLGWSPKTNFKSLIELMVDADLKNSTS